MRGRLSKSWFALMPLLMAACGGGGGGGPESPPPPVPMPPPLTLYSDNGSAIRDSTRVVIRDARTLEEYWMRATSAQASPPPVPSVAFDREMVILVAMGPATPEEEIHVDSLLVRRELNAEGEQEETLTIIVRSVKGCGRFRTAAFPLAIVRVRRFDGPIRWEERVQQVTCGAPDAPLAGASPEHAVGPMRVRAERVR